MPESISPTSEPLFIAVEGPIGVGKTTLAKLLTDKLEGYCLKEIIEENPYLEKFYQNIEEYAFQTEMFFLCNRIKQLEDVRKNQINRGVSVISDYSILKNQIFAGLTLKPDHFQKYEQVFEILTRDLPQPEIIIYLRGDVDQLMERIALRDRPFERNMSRAYMEKLSWEYERYFTPDDLDISPTEALSSVEKPTILPISINDRDFVNHPSDLDYVIQEIFEAIKQRRNRS